MLNSFEYLYINGVEYKDIEIHLLFIKINVF